MIAFQSAFQPSLCKGSLDFNQLSNLIISVSRDKSANYLLHGRAVACCRRWKSTKTKLLSANIKLNSISYRRDSPCGCPSKAPSDEGAVVFRRKMTEGEKAINSKFSLSLLPSRLRRATFLVRGRLYSASIFI